MTVPVRIANQPFRFLIDTGAQNTVLSIATAAQLSLVPDGRAKLIGVAGSQMVDTVEVEQIDLGRRSYFGIVAPLLEGGDIGADGIVGLDSLQDQRVLLDFGKKLMAIGDAKTLGGNGGYEIVVTARRRSGQLIMTDARIDGVDTDVVIDTGAEYTIGNLALRQALSRRRTHEQTVLQSVTGQSITADLAFARQLAIKDMQLSNVLIAFVDAPPFAALDLHRRPAILLGMRDLRAFKRVAIDFSTRKVMFDLPREAF
jgi:predicted aspartyl protease